MHRIAGLKPHHASPSQSHKFGAKLAGGVAQRTKVVVCGKLNTVGLTPYVPGVCPLQDLRHAG